MDLNEARKNLEASLGDEALIQEYFSILRRAHTFKSPITLEECDAEARKLLTTLEQIRCHNVFSVALASEPATTRTKAQNVGGNRHHFQHAQLNDYIQPFSPSNTPPEGYEEKSAAAELFVPDSGLIATKIALTAWNCRMEGAEEAVTELMVHACQTFIRNIITAMVSRVKRYKVRDGKFQYGFNAPIPNPFLYNYKNVVEENEENRTEVVEADDCLVPKMKSSMQKAEQEYAFAFACTKRRKIENVLSLSVLYHTLKDNPRLLGSHEMHSLSLLKLGLLVDP